MKDRPLTARSRSRAYQQALAALRDRHPAEFAALHAAIRLGLNPERVSTPGASGVEAEHQPAGACAGSTAGS